MATQLVEQAWAAFEENDFEGAKAALFDADSPEYVRFRMNSRASAAVASTLYCARLLLPEEGTTSSSAPASAPPTLFNFQWEAYLPLLEQGEPITRRGAGLKTHRIASLRAAMEKQEASDLAGFLPRPEPIQRKPRKKYFTAKVLAFFFLCHAVPAVVAIKYFQKKKAERLRNSLLALPNDADTIVEEVLRVVTSSPDVFLLSADNLSMQRVDALLPEAARVVPRDQETVDQLEALTPSDVAAMFSHVPDPAQPKRTLRQVHLWTSTTSSSSSASPAPGRGAVASSSTSGRSCPTFRGALFYQSSVRHAYCTVKGVFVEVARDDGAEARHDERMNTKATTSLHAMPLLQRALQRALHCSRPSRAFGTAVQTQTYSPPPAAQNPISFVQKNILSEAQRCIILAGLAQNPNVPQYDAPIGTPNNDMRRVGDVPHGYRHTHFVNSQHTRNTAAYTKKLLPIMYFHFVEVVWLLIMYQFA
eukprot:g8588.t1